MKIRVTKSFALIAAACMLAALSACGGETGTIHSSALGATQEVTSDETDQYENTHANVTLSNMFYERPDIGSMQAEVDDLIDGLDRGKPAEEMIELYETLQQQYAHADSMLSLAYLLYAFDVTEPYYKNEYAYLQSALGTLDAEMESVSVQLFESSDEAEKLARQSFGEGYVDTIMQADEFSDDTVQDLLDAEEQKTLEYDELSTTFTLLDNGRRWTLDEIMNDESLDYDEFYRLYDGYCAALNERAGAIFLDQLAIRSRIAQKLGYTDYASYCYSAYGRDYSLDDAKMLQSAVKQYIVPVFIEANNNSDTYDLADAEFDQNGFLSALSNIASDFSPLLDESVDYLLQNNLYDFSVSANKMNGSFTTYISDYGAPYIFSQWYGDSTDIMTALHELGHFTSYYYNAEVGYSAGDSLDLAEIDSQALVLLMIDYYDVFFGEYAQQAKTDILIDAMYSLISGCMEDEFQQEIYQNTDMTLNEINALYKELAVEYGLDEVYGYQGTEWVLISHTYQSPLYYISYAVSMVPSLELYEISQSDPQAARENYFSILMRSQYDQLQSVLSESGMPSVFSETTIRDIADLLEQTLN